MKSSSAKAKGSRFENWIVDIFREQVDDNTSRNYASGSGLDKNDIRVPAFNLDIEAKNQKVLGLKSGFEQLERQLQDGHNGVLMMRHPDYPEFDKVIVAMDLEYFIQLLLKSTDEVEVVKKEDREMKYHLKQMKHHATKLLKELD